MLNVRSRRVGFSLAAGFNPLTLASGLKPTLYVRLPSAKHFHAEREEIRAAFRGLPVM